jgi:Family of unknown function (DUF5681)
MPPLDEGVESGTEIESTDEHSKQSVGYAHPPIATRFRKGQSGNPKGRPKGTKNLNTLINEALSEKINVNENGRRKAISKRQAGAKHVANKVASGDVKTVLRLLEWEFREESLNKAVPTVESGRVISSLPASATAHERLYEITARLRERLAKRETQ